MALKDSNKQQATELVSNQQAAEKLLDYRRQILDSAVSSTGKSGATSPRINRRNIARVLTAIRASELAKRE